MGDFMRLREWSPKGILQNAMPTTYAQMQRFTTGTVSEDVLANIHVLSNMSY